MNGKNDNSINPEITSGDHVTTVQSSKLTVDSVSGAAWLRKYLHPPCATPDGYAGIPDKNNTPSADAEYKGIRQIQTFATEPSVLFNKVLLLHTASAIAPVIAFKYDVGGALYQLPEDVVLNRNINVQDMVAQNSSGRITYKSTTSWLNATNFSNQGDLSTALFRPNITVYRIGDLIKLFARQPNSQQLHSELADFFDGKAHTELHSIESSVSRLAASIDNFAQVVKLGAIPQEGSQIVMMSPNAVSTDAKSGSFVVQRFDQDSIQYKDFSCNGLNGVGVSTLIGMPCYIFEQTGSVGQLEAIKVVGQPGNATAILADLPWSDFLWGWSLYEGLSLASSGVSPPYISVKTITGFEFQPLTDSILSPFIRNSAVYDQSAIQLATITNHAMADSLPSAANFWGSIGKVLLTAAPSIISTLIKVFGSKKKDKPVEKLAKQLGKSRISAPKKPVANNKLRGPMPVRRTMVINRSKPVAKRPKV